jgi:hypothetical protein
MAIPCQGLWVSRAILATVVLLSFNFCCDLAQLCARHPQLCDLCPVSDYPRAPADAVLLPGALQAGNGALAQPNALLLGRWLPRWT